MKKLIFFNIILFAVVFTSCEYDNYDAPSITFKGSLVYNGNNYLFDGNPSVGVITLIQKGFGKIDVGTNVRIDENGAFSQLIFPGDYWLTLANNQYPFEFKDFHSLGTGLGYDTIQMNIKKDIVKNIEVTPYFEIKDFNVSVDNGNIIANFKVKKVTGTVNATPKVIRTRCFVSTSSIVNSATTLSKSVIKSITDSATVSIPVSISTGSTSYRQIYINNYRDYAFCRVALELNGIPNYYIFSETLKVEGLPQ
ncbi:MAG: DUF3823 domain-containing protein [Paludibacter sp.]|nr:DUF3823 domain-containing protein [Paludibacter sp.]